MAGTMKHNSEYRQIFPFILRRIVMSFYS